MGKINVSSDQLAKVKHFSEGGDSIAQVLQAVLDSVRVLTITLGPETVNVIRVTIVVTELDGGAVKAATDVYLQSVPVSGVGTMTIGTKGTLKAGTGTKAVWGVTDATGTIEIDVLNAAAEDTLLTIETDNGESEIVKLTYT